MVKLLSAGALILLVGGCRGEPVGAKVSFVETRVDETQRPLPFVIALRNSGDAAVDVAGVSLAAVEGFAFPSGGGAQAGETSISAADCQVEMREGHPVEVAARGDGVACGFVRWLRPTEATPAVGVAAITFLVTLDDGETVETPARIVLLSSPSAPVETFLEALSLDRDAALEALHRMEALEGDPTTAVGRLKARLKTLSQ